jgi:hypothetical protein
MLLVPAQSARRYSLRLHRALSRAVQRLLWFLLLSWRQPLRRNLARLPRRDLMPRRSRKVLVRSSPRPTLCEGGCGRACQTAYCDKCTYRDPAKFDLLEQNNSSPGFHVITENHRTKWKAL